MPDLLKEKANFPRISLQGWQLIFVTIMLATGNVSIAITQMALAVALVLQLVRWLGMKEPLPPIRMHIAVGLLAGWALLMVPLSSDSSQSLIFYRRFYLFAALWVTAGVATTGFRRWVMLTGLVSGAAAISIFGMVKVYRDTGGLFTTRLGEMSNPMTSGCLLMLALLVCLGIILARGTSWRSRSLVMLAATPIFIGLLQTMTRSAWLGLIVGAVAMVLVLYPRFFGVVLVLCILGGFLLPDIASSLLSEKAASRLQWDYILNGNSTSVRLEMWRGGWEIVKSNPWTGVGDRDLTSVAPEYYGDENTTYFGHLHSNPVMFAVIWGLPGFAFAMGLLGWIAFLLIRGYRTVANNPLAAGWLLGAIGAWAAFFVAGMSEWYFGDAESIQFFLAIVGIALGGVASNTGEDHG